MPNTYPPTSSRRPSPALPANAGPQPGKRTALITLQEELQVLTGPGLVGARRMKIMRIDQSPAGPQAMPLPRPSRQEPVLVSAQPATAPRGALPPPQQQLVEFEGMVNGQRVRLRGVGETMADEAGNLYEVRGQQLRPLGALVSDEHGRIFEVQPVRETTPGTTEPPQASASALEPERFASATNNGHHVDAPSQPAHTSGTPTEPAPAYHTIVADPGLSLHLPWAHVKSELAPYLQHPETLRDHDVLACYAQIYEAQRTLPAAQLAALALGDAAFAAQLQPLTHAKAQMLGVPQLFKPTREPLERRATSRHIYAGQRVYRLWPVFDPTIERDHTSSRPSVASAEKAATLRPQIPQQYLNPLQFRVSREEVLYDMQDVLGTLPPQAQALTRWICIYPLRLLKVSRIVISSGRRLKKWRAMLKGKTPDEQLWAVTPPRGFSYHPTVRRWAGETLTRAGYDPERMLVEWEIFWRRKGWN